jgi:hypothetical protein
VHNLSFEQRDTFASNGGERGTRGEGAIIAGQKRHERAPIIYFPGSLQGNVLLRKVQKRNHRRSDQTGVDVFCRSRSSAVLNPARPKLDALISESCLRRFDGFRPGGSENCRLVEPGVGIYCWWVPTPGYWYIRCQRLRGSSLSIFPMTLSSSASSQTFFQSSRMMVSLPY